jgi:radical SAM protein with 4Fe4S-binding SPASM domain
MFISLESITLENEFIKPTVEGDRVVPDGQRTRGLLPSHLLPQRPTTYTLELTAACNHKCVGCGNVFPRQLKHMSGATWTKLLDDLKTDVVSLRITGGECTLHPDFEEIIRAVDQLGVPYVIFTNGCWRKPDEIIQLFAGCNNLDGLLISLHGKDAESYRAFVVTDSFNEVIQNIRRAAESGVRVGTNTILLRSNKDTIEETTQLSFSLGAASAAFSRYYGQAIPELELTEVELREAMTQIERLHKTEPRILFNNCIPTCFVDVDLPTKGCTSGFTHCTIDPLGNVRPCTHSPFVLGSLLTQDIAKIWDSEPLWEWRNLIPGTCLGCSAFSQCRGGCRATAYHQRQAQDPLIDSPLNSPSTPSTQPLKLSRHARPIPNYKLRHENFGLYLINRNRHISVSTLALPILEMLNGQTTLEEITTQLGQTALDFVGTLILNGLVVLERGDNL